jgi:DNA-binding response OmpR family regulator
MDAKVVLVVEDDADVRDCLEEALTGAGHDVRTATNGREALAVCVDVRPAAILLDLMMPDMDGLAFLLERCRDERLRSVPVVVLTASGVRRVEGARAVLQKPFALDELFAVVDAVA